MHICNNIPNTHIYSILKRILYFTTINIIPESLLKSGSNFYNIIFHKHASI